MASRYWPSIASSQSSRNQLKANYSIKLKYIPILTHTCTLAGKYLKINERMHKKNFVQKERNFIDLNCLQTLIPFRSLKSCLWLSESPLNTHVAGYTMTVLIKMIVQATIFRVQLFYLLINVLILYIHI